MDGSCDKDEDYEGKLLDLITQNNLTLAFSFQTYFLCLVLLKNSFFSLVKEIFWSVKQEIKIELDWWCGKWQRWRIRRWGHCFLITHSNLTLAFSFQTYFLCLVLLKNSFFSLMKEIFWSVKQKIKIEWMDHATSDKDEHYEGEVIVS